MAQNDFSTSPAATGGDSELAADLLTNAAFATSESATPADRILGEERSRTALDHAHSDVRVSAVAALARLEAFTANDLGALLDDESAAVRRRAVEAAAQLIQRSQTTEVIDALIGALSDVDGVAEVAAFALGEFGPDVAPVEPAVAALEQMATGHEDPLCRESAVAALGALHRGRAVILAALNDKATVRRRAVLALAPFEGEDVRAALTTALSDRDWQVRQAAEDQVGPPPEPDAETESDR